MVLRVAEIFWPWLPFRPFLYYSIGHFWSSCGKVSENPLVRTFLNYACDNGWKFAGNRWEKFAEIWKIFKMIVGKVSRQFPVIWTASVLRRIPHTTEFGSLGGRYLAIGAQWPSSLSKFVICKPYKYTFLSHQWPASHDLHDCRWCENFWRLIDRFTRVYIEEKHLHSSEVIIKHRSWSDLYNLKEPLF